MPEPKGDVDPHRAKRGDVSVLEPRSAIPAAPALLFPREPDMRLAQDLLFFAYRDFTNAADVILEELGLGRAHHRALHFIGRNPGITVSDLLVHPAHHQAVARPRAERAGGAGLSSRRPPAGKTAASGC